jgi:hypothetical protein
VAELKGLLSKSSAPETSRLLHSAVFQVLFKKERQMSESARYEITPTQLHETRLQIFEVVMAKASSISAAFEAYPDACKLVLGPCVVNAERHELKFPALKSQGLSNRYAECT